VSGYQRLNRHPEQRRPFADLLDLTMRQQDMSPAELARRANLSRNHVSQLLDRDNRVSLSPEVALSIADATGLDAEHIVKVDAAWRTAKAFLDSRERLTSEMGWARSFPIDELKRRQLLDVGKTGMDLVKAMRRFFAVASEKAWTDVWSSKSLEYRRAHDAKADDYAIRAWLRIGEIDSQLVDTEKFDKGRVAAAIPELRELTTAPIDEAWPAVRDLLAKSGVALVMVEEFKTLTKINGATNWVRADKVVLQLSSRGKRVDVLWFNLFHELSHVLHDGKRTIHVTDMVNHRSDLKAEEAANDFAARTLIPAHAQGNLRSKLTAPELRALAADLGVAECIVVGQYLHAHDDAPALYRRHAKTLRRYGTVEFDGLTGPIPR
jgi:HTH-type transcriptional regulator/antitoxin HigA